MRFCSQKNSFICTKLLNYLPFTCWLVIYFSFPLHIFLFAYDSSSSFAAFILFLFFDKMASCISSYKFPTRMDFCFFWEQSDFDISLLRSECNLLMPWLSESINPFVVWDDTFRQTGINLCAVQFSSRKSSIVPWIRCFSTDWGLPHYFAECSR